MFYWHSVEGGTLAESDLGGNWTAVYGLVRGQIYSRVDLSANSNVVHYYFQDHLKSTDVVTDANGAILKESDYYPYGGEIVISGSDSNRYKFNGKERGTESCNAGMCLDDFGARYYGSSLGRFMTPDWAAKPIDVPYANFGNPQSLNLYSYVENNPATLGDPDGHMFWAPYVSGGFVGNLTALVGQGAQSELGQGLTYFGTLADEAEAAAQAAAQSAQAQNQSQKYDPKKSGPEDPTNPGHPLSQNADVKKASDQAFMKTGNGQARSGLAEAGFAIDYKDGKLSVVNKVDSVNGDGKPNQLHITTDDNTIAILHTHGNKALATPSEGDLKSPVPNFVRSQRDLYVTVPGTTTYIQLQ